MGCVPLGPLGEVTFKMPDVAYHVTFFECEVKAPSLLELERHPEIHSRLEWVSIDRLGELDWVGSNAEFARWLVAYNKKRHPISGD